jgi:hypothetical protein
MPLRRWRSATAARAAVPPCAVPARGRPSSRAPHSSVRSTRWRQACPAHAQVRARETSTCETPRAQPAISLRSAERSDCERAAVCCPHQASEVRARRDVLLVRQLDDLRLSLGGVGLRHGGPVGVAEDFVALAELRVLALRHRAHHAARHRVALRQIRDRPAAQVRIDGDERRANEDLRASAEARRDAPSGGHTPGHADGEA